MHDLERGTSVDVDSPVSGPLSGSKSSLEESYHDDDEKQQDRPTVATTSTENFIVDWDGPDDPEHPQNLSRKRKFGITCSIAGLVSTFTFGSSVFSAATVVTAERFNVSPEVMILGTSLYILGLGLGPTFFGPMSELYGRTIPMFSGFIIFMILQIPVAVATNVQSVLIFRFLQGFFGSSPTAVAGGALADIWDARERGFAMPSFAGTLFAGPMLGPIIGAFVTESYLGWRWTQWITMIMGAVFLPMTLIFTPETYAPVLLARRAKQRRFETGNWAWHAKHEERRVDLKEIANRYLARPARMMVQEPILMLFTLYLAFVFGLIYLFFEAYPISFSEDRGMSAGVGGLPLLSILIGVLLGCTVIATTTRTRLAPNPAEGRSQETRLLLMGTGAIALPIGLFWFAWTSFPSISPWPQIISGVPIGYSVIVITLQGMNYVIDCYTMNANSALAGMMFVRSWFGAGFPLFAGYMFHGLGVQLATTTLACISVALAPVPFLFYKFGATIRRYSKFVPD